MNELNKTNRLTIAVVAFAIVIIIGLVTFQRPEVTYKLSPTETLALLNNDSLTVTPLQASDLMKNSQGKYIFIDVRNAVLYGQGHLRNAINIPVREFLTEKSRHTLKEIAASEQTAVLYGETPQQANGPWMMLLQTGFKNIKLFTGNYSQLNLAPDDTLSKLLPQRTETPLIDTAALKAVSSPAVATQKTTKTATPQKVVLPVKKQVSSGGGC